MNESASGDRATVAPRVVLAGGFDDAGRTRWVRGLLAAIIANDPGARCSVVCAAPGRGAFAGRAAPPGRVTLLARRPPCLCCPDAGLVDDLARLAALRPAWIVVELSAATLAWTRGELRRTLPESRTVSVIVRRPAAAGNEGGAGLWDLPGLADFEVRDESSAENTIRAIVRGGASRGGAPLTGSP